MSNSFFQFKQFIIQQENCAMKVCTDACLFGGYVAEKIHTSSPPISYCLDIGTGTGLLSLMAAQKSSAFIDALEIDQQAYRQAKENFESSLWHNRLTVHHTNALNFISKKKYDFIFSNPPFFGNDLKSDSEQKNAAKHDTTLTLEQLLAIIDANLLNDGSFAILLPYQRVDTFIADAKKIGFYIEEKILVKQTPSHNYFRGILLFSRKETAINNTSFSIKNKENQYTENFIELLKDYYLHL